MRSKLRGAANLAGMMALAKKRAADAGDELAPEGDNDDDDAAAAAARARAAVEDEEVDAASDSDEDAAAKMGVELVGAIAAKLARFRSAEYAAMKEARAKEGGCATLRTALGGLTRAPGAGPPPGAGGEQRGADDALSIPCVCRARLDDDARARDAS